VILNASAGRYSGNSRDIALLFSQYGYDVEIHVVPAGKIQPTAENLSSRFPRIVVGGGDGSVGAAAAALVGTQTELAILPIGTLNHFARDLGIPRALPDAVRVAVSGSVAQVDTAEVNGKIFVNNSSLGVYPRWVRNRRVQREVLGRGRWRTLFRALLAVFRRFPSIRVLIQTPNRVFDLKTAFLFVGNNEYQTGPSLGRRARLDSEILQLQVGRSSGRFALLKNFMRALTGTLRGSADFDFLLAKELWIFTARKRVHVALDGEVVYLKQPLHYCVRPRSLRVLRDIA